MASVGNILSDIVSLFSSLSVPCEVGEFTSQAGEKFAVIAPMYDYGLQSDDVPEYDVQEARISYYTRGNFVGEVDGIIDAFRSAGYGIPSRLFLGKDTNTGYYQFSIDVQRVYAEQVDETDERSL